MNQSTHRHYSWLFNELWCVKIIISMNFFRQKKTMQTITPHLTYQIPYLFYQIPRPLSQRNLKILHDNIPWKIDTNYLAAGLKIKQSNHQNKIQQSTNTHRKQPQHAEINTKTENRGTWRGGFDGIEIGHCDWRLYRNEGGWGRHKEEEDEEENADANWITET